MFDHDYEISGIHATYLKSLFELKLFERYIDVYMTAAVVGALNKRKKTIVDNTSKDRARIYADAFCTEHVKCEQIFRTIVLSDKSMNWSQDDKINICFRYRDIKDDNAVIPITDEEIKKMQEALSLFNDYVYGGLELLFETFGDKSDPIDLINTIYKTIYDHKTFIESMEDVDGRENLFQPEY